MDKFIGRKDELASLQELYNKKGFQMAVLFGRRRVGKTTLVNRFIEINKCKSVSFVSTEMPEAELLERMGNDALDSLAPNLSGKLKFDSFDSIFDFIAEESEKEQIVFVIDEYPYLAKSCTYMNSLLQKYIDNKWKKSNLFFILLGSLVSFMREDVLGSSAPLHGRANLESKSILLITRIQLYSFQTLIRKKKRLFMDLREGLQNIWNSLAVRFHLMKISKNYSSSEMHFFLKNKLRLLSQQKNQIRLPIIQ